MLHDIMIDPRQLKAVAEWVEGGDSMAPVELLKTGKFLLVGQGDSRAEFDEYGDKIGGVE